MPRLHQRKDGDGYYVRAALPGTSNINTWQINPEGLRFLRSRGYEGDGVQFPDPILKELIDRGYVYTRGSGIGVILPKLQVTSSDSSPSQARLLSQGAALLFLEGEPAWNLALRISELPRSWIEGADHLVDALSSWQIQVAGKVSVPATHLWPGRGGALIPVAPQSEPYTVTPEGRWPEAWDVRRWLGEIPGLGPGATLFSVETGARLAPGTALECGGAYVLVAPADPAMGRGRWPPPAMFSPEDLGRNGRWQAWTIELPASGNLRVRAWCDATGYRLAEPRFKLSLVTPAQGYSDHGSPIVPVGEEIVLCLAPVREDTGVEYRPTFYTTRFQAPGTYRVTIDDVSTGGLSVIAERPQTHDLRQPAALEICITVAGSTIGIQALRDGFGPHSIPPCVNGPGKPPTVEVKCSVPLSLSWESGTVRERRGRLAANEAEVLIADILREASRTRERLDIQLDAGAYGRLGLTMPAPLNTPRAIDALPPMTVGRARWLATQLSIVSTRDTLVPLPRHVRQTLDALADLPGCAALRGLFVVPATLIPHVQAITKLVQL